MFRSLIAISAGVALIAGCSPGAEQVSLSHKSFGSDAKLFDATLPSKQEMADGLAPIEYRQIVDLQFDRALSRPHPRKVDDELRPYGGLACGTIDFTADSNVMLADTPFVGVFNAKGGLYALKLFTKDDVASIKAQHSASAADQGSAAAYFALQKCGFIK